MLRLVAKIDGLGAKCLYCDVILGPPEMLKHMQLKHICHLNKIEAHEGWPLFFPIDVLQLQPEANHVLGAFVYSSPMEFLPNELQLVQHEPPLEFWPMLLMLYVGPRCQSAIEQQVFLFYLVAAHCSEKIYAEVSLWDEDILRKHKGVRCLRNKYSFSIETKSDQRLHCGSEFLKYLDNDFKNLCSNQKHKLCVKLCLYGCPSKLFGIE